MRIERVCIVGLGYIGLPTAAVFASRAGIATIGYDINASVVGKVNNGEIHIVEPGLEEAVRLAVSGGLLTATTEIPRADVFVIAVPTPVRDDNEPDMSIVMSAVESIAPRLAKGNLVILESTSMVGSTVEMARRIAELRPDLTVPHATGDPADIHLAYCPERVLPGKTMEELVTNDRVIGGVTSACTEHAVAFYKRFVEGECIPTNAPTAELCKLSENAFRDVNIAFANELSLVCARLGINVWELIRLANHHPRVNILQPGPGVGGHCIAVDPYFIISSAPEEARLIATAREVNSGKPHWVVSRILQAAAHMERASGTKPIIACYGLAFKPDIDDIRESPALEVVEGVAAAFAGNVLAVDPFVSGIDIPNARAATVEEALAEATLHCFLVKHRMFFGLAGTMRAAPAEAVLDFCGLLGT